TAAPPAHTLSYVKSRITSPVHTGCCSNSLYRIAEPSRTTITYTQSYERGPPAFYIVRVRARITRCSRGANRLIGHRRLVPSPRDRAKVCLLRFLSYRPRGSTVRPEGFHS